MHALVVSLMLALILPWGAIEARAQNGGAKPSIAIAPVTSINDAKKRELQRIEGLVVKGLESLGTHQIIGSKAAEKATRKARKLGLTWEEAPASLAEMTGGRFRALYDGTMERVSAKPYYFFGDRYYELLHAALGDDLRLAQVRNADGDVVAAALFMRWGDLLHYHLAGSERDAARLGANNLLLDGMIAWGFEHGLRLLHLGTGITAGDALYKFKVQFGGRLLPYWLLRTVLDEERYAVLTQRRATATKREPRELLESGFFPAYRA